MKTLDLKTNGIYIVEKGNVPMEDDVGLVLDDGDLVKLYHDDDTDIPLFKVVSSAVLVEGICQYIHVGHLRPAK